MAIHVDLQHRCGEFMLACRFVFRMTTSSLNRSNKKVKVSIDQEMARSERNSHSINRDGKKN